MASRQGNPGCLPTARNADRRNAVLQNKRRQQKATAAKPWNTLWMGCGEVMTAVTATVEREVASAAPSRPRSMSVDGGLPGSADQAVRAIRLD